MLIPWRVMLVFFVNSSIASDLFEEAVLFIVPRPCGSCIEYEADSTRLGIQNAGGAFGACLTRGDCIRSFVNICH